jgi:N-acetyl-anhydromuramyl-L-alanine amidase AmpD
MKIVTTIPNRDIKLVRHFIIHCSDSDRPEDDNIKAIREWHLERGFLDVGYHFFIPKNGVIEQGRNLWQVGAHCAGYNTYSIGICLSGKKDFVERQFSACATLIKKIHSLYPTTNFRPIRPHNYFNDTKTCPNFDVALIEKYL